MKFSKYHFPPALQDNLSKMGFKRPTDIQFKCIPNILKGEDVLAISQTGTGKTAAFAVPIISILSDKKERQRRADGIKCLVMVPTRELAMQIYETFRRLSEGTGVTCGHLFGGVDQSDQIVKLDRGYDILITTPGRMFDLEHQGHLKLHRVEILVLDEADYMLELGFVRDIEDVLRKLPKMRQTLFFSATINPAIKKTAYKLIRSSAIRIQISPKNPVNRNINHIIAKLAMDDKRFFLERLINENKDSKILVFVRTKIRAERVMKAMDRVEIQAETIHSDKDQKDRFEVMNRFRDGINKVLIATDVTARGIDIPNVDYVVNYDLPEEPERYVHRVGRTGRGKQRGEAVSFCAPEEEELLNDIESYIGMTIERLEINYADYEDTLDFSTSKKENLKELMKKVEEIEQKKGKRKKK